MEHRSQRLAYRDFLASDEDALLQLANNFNVSCYMVFSFPYPYTQEAAHYWVTQGWCEHGMVNYAVCLEEQFVGSVGYSLQTHWRNHIAEIGYWFGEPFWGQGLGSEGLHWLVETVFEQHPQVSKLSAPVLADNIASRRVLEKRGFRLDGQLREEVQKHDKLHDVCYYSLLRVD